jgi:hypothetical protein
MMARFKTNTLMSAPAGADMRERSMNSSQPLSETSHKSFEIIRADARMFIVQSTACCRKCGDLTRVVTLAACPEGEALPAGEFGFLLLLHIRKMPSSLLHKLQRYCPSYRLCFDGVLGMLSYRNACASCGDVFEDEDLFSEPGDAFNPYDESDYERIKIIDADYLVEYKLRIEPDGDYRSFGGIEAAYGPEPDMWDWYLNVQCE